MRAAWVLCALLLCVAGFATPDLVFHGPTNSVFGEPGNVTMREPDVPREDEAVQIWIKVGPSFSYDQVAVYCTVDGSTPIGTRGDPAGSTFALRSSSGQVTFIRNEPRTGGGNDDWWLATLPASTRSYGATIKYKLSAWQNSGGEVFANSGGAAQVFTYVNKLAWPGAGRGSANPAMGYPPVRFWKEEGVTGNGSISTMLDQNGTIYDIYYPGVGATNGVACKNEGYSDGFDTFPPGLPADHRGQMHVNQLMTGIRVDGLTHWLSNENGGSFTNVQQTYIGNTNVLQTSQTLSYGSSQIFVIQTDLSPAGITFPIDQAGASRRGIHIKRTQLVNQSATTKTLNFYFFADWAVNGSDTYDVMSVDATRNAMVVTDNTYRVVTAQGNFIPPGNEYNPSSFAGYEKNVSLVFGAAMKAPTFGGPGGTWSTDSWRDTSTDTGQGWIGTRVTLPPGQSTTIDVVIAGGFDAFAGANGTYNFQVAPVLDWFAGVNVSLILSQTASYWTNWLASGTLVDFPDDRIDQLYRRGLLATALHIDHATGAIIAGMHNGAYPYAWPRDMMYATITLAKTGHRAEALAALNWMRQTAFRGNEPWGQGFFSQKYTVDGYTVWSAPQVDETAVYPWAFLDYVRMTGDTALLTAFWPGIRDSAFAMSSDSTLDSRLRFEEGVNLMYSMNIWEDSFDVHNYSNANVVRGLRDAATLAGLAGQIGDQATFTQRANLIETGLLARLDWNGEKTDISQLGISYPFEVVPAGSSRANLIMSRIEGTAQDRFGNTQPLTHASGEFSGLVDRYWQDGYWNGQPWWLSTLWYGLARIQRADGTAGATDIDPLYSQLIRLQDVDGQLGFGSEQIAPISSASYPDFKLQAAWPNVWESMSTAVDSIMAFLDLQPDALSQSLTVSPKLPTGVNTLRFDNVRVGNSALNFVLNRNGRTVSLTVTVISGPSITVNVWLRGEPNRKLYGTYNGVRAAIIPDHAVGKAKFSQVLSGTGVFSLTWSASDGGSRTKTP